MPEIIGFSEAYHLSQKLEIQTNFAKVFQAYYHFSHAYIYQRRILAFNIQHSYTKILFLGQRSGLAPIDLNCVKWAIHYKITKKWGTKRFKKERKREINFWYIINYLHFQCDSLDLVNLLALKRYATPFSTNIRFIWHSVFQLRLQFIQIVVPQSQVNNGSYWNSSMRGIACRFLYHTQSISLSLLSSLRRCHYLNVNIERSVASRVDSKSQRFFVTHSSFCRTFCIYSSTSSWAYLHILWRTKWNWHGVSNTCGLVHFFQRYEI